MAIAKKPNRHTNEIPAETAAEDFISKAGGKREAEAAAESRASVMIRFDRKLLERVDAASKKRGVSRSAWIQFTVSRALDGDEG